MKSQPSCNLSSRIIQLVRLQKKRKLRAAAPLTCRFSSCRDARLKSRTVFSLWKRRIYHSRPRQSQKAKKLRLSTGRRLAIKYQTTTFKGHIMRKVSKWVTSLRFLRRQTLKWLRRLKSREVSKSRTRRTFFPKKHLSLQVSATQTCNPGDNLLKKSCCSCRTIKK